MVFTDWCLGGIAELRNATVSSAVSACLSVRPRGTTLLPLDEFSWRLIFERFSKFCREN
jgi:hypothetical protein